MRKLKVRINKNRFLVIRIDSKNGTAIFLKSENGFREIKASVDIPEAFLLPNEIILDNKSVIKALIEHKILKI